MVRLSNPLQLRNNVCARFAHNETINLDSVAFSWEHVLTMSATAKHDFGTSASNLRGQCYPLPEKDAVGYDSQALLFAVKGLLGWLLGVGVQSRVMLTKVCSGRGARTQA